MDFSDQTSKDRFKVAYLRPRYIVLQLPSVQTLSFKFNHSQI